MGNKNYFFQHDHNARSDKKLRGLLRDHGGLAYGLYWILVEMMHESEDNYVVLDELLIDELVGDLKIDKEKLLCVLDDCVDKYKLFQRVDMSFTSKRVYANKERIKAIKSIRSAAGKKSAEVRKFKKVNKPATNVEHKLNTSEHELNKNEQRKESSSKEEQLIVELAERLKTYRPDISKQTAVIEARLLVTKSNQAPTESYIALWAQKIRNESKTVVMMSPIGQEVRWTPEEYEAKRNKTGFTFLRYDEVGRVRD